MSIRFNLYDIAYWLAVGGSSPYWLIKPSARRKVLRGLRERMGHVAPRTDSHRTDSQGPAILIHAVSLGEMNATRALVEMLRARRDDLHIIVSTTTDTGFEQGRKLYGDNPHVSLIRYPLDFSPAVHRTLDSLRPSVVVLMELELWPNFVRACRQRGIAVILANGRLTGESYSRYRWVKPIVAAMLRRVDRLCVQDDLYAQRFMSLGARPKQISVIGTMKFDTATVADSVDGDAALARDVGLRGGDEPSGDEPIWVCGSTGPGEEAIVLRIYRSLRQNIPALRLVIVPRKPERFDEVANLIRANNFRLVRRSNPPATPGENAPTNLPENTREITAENAVILGDSMGELRKFYSLASVVFVGRSLVDLGARQHGSDMIEPAALGKAVLVGPFTGNFAEAVRLLKAAQAIVEVPDEAALAATVSALAKNPTEAQALGTRARDAVLRQQGATARHVEIILAALAHRATT
ncbi:lipid IV(A) 3-deoxy-D-manno-octulosonic acid transferase [soil metagenome]